MGIARDCVIVELPKRAESGSHQRLGRSLAAGEAERQLVYHAGHPNCVELHGVAIIDRDGKVYSHPCTGRGSSRGRAVRPLDD